LTPLFLGRLIANHGSLPDDLKAVLVSSSFRHLIGRLRKAMRNPGQSGRIHGRNPRNPQSEIDKLHSEAFRNLEPSICDCESMAKIAAQITMNTKTEDRELVFAVVHAMEMLTALKTNYYAAWHGEKQTNAT
jgi:hypothetical protein